MRGALLKRLGLVCALALLAGCAQAVPAPATAPQPGVMRLALMPLEDFGDQMGGSFQVGGYLERDLARLGYEVADEASLRRLLLRERVRHRGLVSRALCRMIGKEMDAPVLFLGAVTQYRAGPDPCISLVARMVEARTGRLLWTGVASATGGQFQTLLGLGRIQDASRLSDIEVARLLESLPPAQVMAGRLSAPEEGGR